MVSHAGLKSAEIVDLGSKHQIGELSVRQEDDEEHDGKTHKVLGAARHRGGELAHGLVEVDELKKLRGKRKACHSKPVWEIWIDSDADVIFIP